MTIKKPGIAFEKLVSNIQQQLDPTATVTHNELLTDRHGHRRQFDVVIRGLFAGQEIIGVIECKDFAKKVGTPEIDAFITKATDINANFKIVVSRKGFSKPAIEKARHYGIQTLSLIPGQGSDGGFLVGCNWFADIYHWTQVNAQPHYVNERPELPSFDVNELRINGKKVIDWYTNYLLEHHRNDTELGWCAGVEVLFNYPQTVQVADREYRVNGVTFYAHRICEKKVRMVGWTGTGFYDWQKGTLKAPNRTTLQSHPVPMDMSVWDDRTDDNFVQSGMLYGHIIAHSKQLEFVNDAISLESL